jgi:hypothetical protein
MTRRRLPVRLLSRSKALSPGLGKRLLAYTTVAGATAVCAASHAEAEIVYTPAHNNVNLDYYLDLNHDGILDFHIHSSQLSSFGKLEVFPSVLGNRIVAVHQRCYFSSVAAAALSLGAMIGPDTPQLPQANCMADSFEDSVNGPWLGVKDRYLGFEFLIEGKKHYGWARMNFQVFGCYECIGRVLGYAYETIPGKPIAAGDEGSSTEADDSSATLGALARGAPGLDISRRRGN